MWRETALLSCMVLLNVYSVSCVDFVNNGYDNLVVVIDRRVAQDNAIIDEIKNIITDASPYLYEATDRRTFFRSVSILVPDTWVPEVTWSQDTGQLTLKNADVRVDQQHPMFGDDPYVFQPGQCGEPGHYIHLTPDFVLDPDNNRKANYGNAGRVFVHEFAHFRYGVLDEYGFKDSIHPAWYLVGTEARPTGCAENIKGYIHDNNEACQTNFLGLPTDSCVFVPDVSGANTITASIMAYQFLESVTKFCKAVSSDPNKRHNLFAPNQHNKMCGFRSTSDVIMNHDDFRLSDGEGEFTTPTFRVVRVSQTVSSEGTKLCGRRVVLVLDTSGSMRTNERYFKLGQVSDRLIRDVLPAGTQLGIVDYDSTAKVWRPVTMVINATDRHALASTLPTESDVGGGTSIGGGLLEALNLLQQNDTRSDGGHVILVTDGEQTNDPRVEDIMSEVTDSGVTVHTIAVGPDADGILVTLADLTHGKFASYSESPASTALDSAMSSLLNVLSTCEERDLAVEIERLGVVINSTTTTVIGEVIIDSSVGTNTVFIFSYSKDASISISVRDAEGNVYNSSSPHYTGDDTLNIVRFTFDTAQTGTWTYTIASTSVTAVKDELVIVVVKSHAIPDGVPPVAVDSWVNSVHVDVQSSAPIVYADVHRGYEPLIRARVQVFVDRSPEPEAVIVLKDDGIPPDNRENDGVYTAPFVDIADNTRYSMQVRVEAVAGQTAFITSGSSRSSRAPSIYQNTTKPYKEVLADNFTRTSSPGAVDITWFTPGLDLFPPGVVSDLHVAALNSNDATVTLAWTAPGDDYSQGTANRYELRMAGSFDDLHLTFNMSRLITDADVTEGTLTPLPAGSNHHVTVVLPSDWTHDSYIFGLKSFDETNRSAELSNFASATFKEVTLPETLPKSEPVNMDALPMIAIILGAVAGGVVLLLCVIVVCVVARKNKAPQNPKGRP